MESCPAMRPLSIVRKSFRTVLHIQYRKGLNNIEGILPYFESSGRNRQGSIRLGEGKEKAQ